MLVREQDRAGYELLLRCEPGAAARTVEAAPDLSWRLGVPIEASADEGSNAVLLRCGAPPPDSAQGLRDPVYGLVPCGAAGGAACYLNLGSVGAVALFAPERTRRALLRDWLTALRATAGSHYQIWVDNGTAALLGFEDGGSGSCADLLAHLRDGGGPGEDGVIVLAPAGAAECGAAGDLALDPGRSCQLIIIGETPTPDWPGPVLAYHAGAPFGAAAASGAAPANTEGALFRDEDELAADLAGPELSLVLPEFGASFPLARLVVQRGDSPVPTPAPFPAEDRPRLSAPNTPGSFAAAVEPSPALAGGPAGAGTPDHAGAETSASGAPVLEGEPVAADEAARTAAAAGGPLTPAAADGAGAAPPGAASARTPLADPADVAGLMRIYGDTSALIATARQVDRNLPRDHVPEAIELLEGACVAAAESGSPHLPELEARLADLRSWAAELEGGTAAPDAEAAGGVLEAAEEPATPGDVVAGETAEGGDTPGSAREATGRASTAVDGLSETETREVAATAEGDAGATAVATADETIATGDSASGAPKAEQVAAEAAGAMSVGRGGAATASPTEDGATTLPLPLVDEDAPVAAESAAAQDQEAPDGWPDPPGPAQTVHLRLLGSARVLVRTQSGEYDELQLRPDARDLLTYLLATADRCTGVWPVAELGSRLWPGGKARLAIRRTSNEVSGAITARANVAIDIVAVSYNGEEVALAADLYGSDLEQCRALIAAAEAAAAVDDASAALRNWVQAAALIEGAPLPGNSGGWAPELRRQLQREIGEALDRAVAFAHGQRAADAVTLLAEGAARVRGEQPRSAA